MCSVPDGTAEDFGDTSFYQAAVPKAQKDKKILAFAVMKIRLYFTSAFGVQYSMFDIQKKAVPFETAH